MILSENTTLTGNGIGTLTDAVSAIVTHEINGQYELMITYPVTGIHYSELAQNRIIWAEPDNMTAPQAFRIYRITRPLNGIVTVYARHIAYDMSGIIAEPYTASSLQTALSGLASHCVPSCPFTFTTARAVASPFKVSQPTALWSLLGGQQGSFLDVYGGEWSFDNFAATLTSHLGADRGVSVRYGKNMTELEQDLTIEATYVGIYPFWYDGETDTLVTLPEKYISTTGTGSRILILDFSGDFETQPTASQLRTRAQSYIAANNIGEPQISWKVSFAQLAQDPQYADIAALEQVQLGDTIHIFYEPMNLEASSRAVKIEYDVLMKRYRSVTLGRVKQNLAAIVAGTSQEIQKAVSASRTAIDRAIENSTDFIKNGTGYMRFIYNDAGDLMEIVSLDNPDINQARKVWRWNNGGIGFSSTGYNGTYTTAITQDGSIVADFITTGTLNAARIKAGVLADEAGKFSLNLVTGELHVEQIDLVAEKLDNLGGRNYAWAVAEKYHPNNYAASNCSSTYDASQNGEYVVTATGTSSSFTQIQSRYYDIPADLIGQEVIFHADQIIPSRDTLNPRVYIIVGNAGSAQIGAWAIVPGTKSLTFTVPSNAAKLQVLLRIAQTQSLVAAGDTLTVSGVKLERGTVATDWTPAPEDDASAIAANKAAIKVNAEGISSKVSKEDYNGNVIASLINQTATTTQIQASKINLTGYVTASSLTASGTTTIDGSRITTGHIDADRIAVEDLNALGATIAGWTIGTTELSKSWSGSLLTHKAGINAPATPSNTDAAFYVSATVGSATTYPFRVNYDGKLIATSAEIEGTITSSNATITGGSISITTSDATTDVITLKYGANSVTMRPGQIVLEGSTTYARLLTGLGSLTLSNIPSGSTTADSTAYLSKLGTLELTTSAGKADLTPTGLVFRNTSDTVTAQYPAAGLAVLKNGAADSTTVENAEYHLPLVTYTDLGIANTADNVTFLTALVKWIATNYPHKTNCRFSGVVQMNSNRMFDCYIYNTSAVSGGVPRYGAGHVMVYNGQEYSFSLNNYVITTPTTGFGLIDISSEFTMGPGNGSGNVYAVYDPSTNSVRGSFYRTTDSSSVISSSNAIFTVSANYRPASEKRAVIMFQINHTDVWRTYFCKIGTNGVISNVGSNVTTGAYCTFEYSLN